MRLIDADALIEKNADIIDCEIDHPKYQDTLREIIENAPIIDIVRCGECKYVDSKKCPMYFMGLGYTDDDFCSYGERMK